MSTFLLLYVSAAGAEWKPTGCQVAQSITLSLWRRWPTRSAHGPHLRMRPGNSRVMMFTTRGRLSAVRDCTYADIPGDAMPPLRGRRTRLRDDIAPAGSVISRDVISTPTPRPYRLPLLCGFAPRWLAVAAIACPLCMHGKDRVNRGWVFALFPRIDAATRLGLPVVSFARDCRRDSSSQGMLLC